MFTKEESLLKIKRLVESFGSKIEYIKNSGQYKEAQIEDEFIKPLFRYLNWNVSNEGINNSADREFIVQAQGRDGKEPDYILRLDQKPKFYIEAKHTKYDLKKKTEYIWQAYQYAYSTQSLSLAYRTDFALLTDFEEFRFFDCTFPIKNKELLNNFVAIDWVYTDYIDKFDQLWGIFERENVKNGSLEKLYLSEKKVKENRIPPDRAFLLDLDDENDGWRIKLAKDIKKNHPDYSAEFITQSVQLILDRFIFMKVIIDREIEEDVISKIIERLSSERNNNTGKVEFSVYDHCKDIFEKFDKTYNGSIFIKRAELDAVTVSNKTLIEILKDFTPKNSRYNFKVIPVEILGTIYEQFLGKIVITTDKRARIEYKPEIRKAGGVYYTPDFVVRYITEKTVGEVLNSCRTIEDLQRIKICDPACGSGSFLLIAYDLLIRWAINYYSQKKLTRDEEKIVYKDETGQIRLSSKLKREILKSCIFGVDIDPQAVEVTRMSLSLKALEDTRHAEVYNERTLWHTTILPPLEGNIKCGNSLISTDIYKQHDLFASVDDEIKKINAFDWKDEFPQIFKVGGFDIVIGNPPYGAEITGKFQGYLKSKFSTYVLRGESYLVFVENSISILKNKGLFGQILPDTYLNLGFTDSLRKYLLENTQIKEIVLLPSNVFKAATVDTTLLFAVKQEPLKPFHPALVLVKVFNKKSQSSNLSIPEREFTISTDVWNHQGSFNLQTNRREFELITKIEFDKKKIEDLANIFSGIKVYEVGKGTPPQTEEIRDTKPFTSEVKLNKSWSPFFDGKHIGRYQLLWKENNYIQYGKWLAAPRDSENFQGEKILIRKIVDKTLISSYASETSYCNTLLFVLKLKNTDISYFSLLGILNSHLIGWYFRKKFQVSYEDTFPQIMMRDILQFPIPKIEKLKRDALDVLVRNLLDLNNTLTNINTQSEKDSLSRQIAALNKEVDNLIFELYELSEEDIEIIEESVYES